MKPITVKELKKHGRILEVYIEETHEDFTALEGKDELDGQRDVAALHIRDTNYPNTVIEVSPVMRITDDHIAVCRLKFRRCKNQ